MKILTLNFDGGNTAGIATWAVLAKSNDKVIAKLTGLVDESFLQTNNVSEWWSLYMAVVYAYTQSSYYDSFEFQGDSELVVKQAKGEYAVSKPHLKPLHSKTINTLFNLGRPYQILWIPREQNTEVDELGRTIRVST